MKRLLVIGALLLAPSALGAQDAEARIEAARMRIAELGYSSALLDERVAEGRAKGVPAERIASAVERRAEALQEAGRVLGPLGSRPSTAELSAGADAVEAGIPANVLGGLASRAGAADRAVAFAVLTFLHVEEGLPVETAIARVTAALDQGTQTLRDLPARSVAAQRARAGAAAGTGTTDRASTGAVRQTGGDQRPGVVRPGESPPPQRQRPGQSENGRR